MTIYSVNGKEPVVVWIPSLDTSGNGTTTLNDLVGSNDGTLTNMDASTDWVSDTDNGGVRALDFDGTNDRVDASTITSLTSGTPFTVSLWAKPSSDGTGWYYVGGQTSNNATLAGFIFWNGLSGSNNQFEMLVYHTVANVGRNSSFNVVDNNVWQHLAGTWDGSTNGTGIKLYKNGSEVAYTNTNNGSGTHIAHQGSFVIGGRTFDNNRNFPGRIDDIRIFDQVLDANDIAYLYDSGSGRGIVTTSVIARPRINGGLLNNGLINRGLIR